MHKHSQNTQTNSLSISFFLNSNSNIKYNTANIDRFNVKLPNRYVVWGMGWFSNLHTRYELFIDGSLINRHTGNCCIKEKFWYFALFRGISYLFPEVSKKYFHCTFLLLLNVYNTIADIITINPAGNEFTFLNHYWLERTLLSSFLLEILYSVPVNSTLHPADSISQVYRLTSLD